MIRRGIRRVFHLPLRRRDRWEREVEEEIKLHLALRVEQLMAQGQSADAAYAEAVRRFGPLTASRARLIDAARHRETRMRRTEYLSDLRQDVAFAVRTLARQKAWTAVTIVTLALGIGATSAVFSVMSTMLLHILPYPHADRVVIVDQEARNGNHTGIRVVIAPATNAIRAWRGSSHSFEALEPAQVGPRTLKTASGEPSSVRTVAVLPSFPAFAGAHPIRGRMFTDEETTAGSHTVLLGEGFWRERLGADPNVIGKTITLSDSSYTVVGVLPASLRFGLPDGRATDVWLPFNLHEPNGGGSVLGRLRPGVAIDQAKRELDSIYARAAGFTAADVPFTTVIATPAQQVSFRDSLVLLTAAVGLLLLVACVNVAHLLLARAATRQRELAVRTALGAGRGRIFRQLLTESILLTSAGTAAGLAAGWLALRLMITLRPASHDELKAAHLDGFTLAVTIAVAVASGLAFGVIGAMQSTGRAPHDALKTGSASSGLARGQRRTRAVLVVSEIALSVMLVVGAGLVVRSLQRLRATDLGFDPHGLYMLDVRSYGRRADSTRRLAAVREIEQRLRTVPGVQVVSAAEVGPGSRSFTIGRLQVDGEPTPPASATSFTDVNHVQPSYFATMQIRFVEGAPFTDTTTRVVIVNESFARKYWALMHAVGQRLRIAQSDTEPWLTIVGVVRDARTSGPGFVSSAPMLYLPPSVNVDPEVLVRMDGNAARLAALRPIAKQLGFRDLTIESAEHVLDRSISEPRFVMLVLTTFSVVALVLASVGLYGVLAYMVALETRETGIRIALGASRRRVMASVLGRGGRLALAGVAAGLAGASWGTKLIANELYGVERFDAISFAAAAVVLITAAMIACVVPTRRALAIDPMMAIRGE